MGEKKRERCRWSTRFVSHLPWTEKEDHSRCLLWEGGKCYVRNAAGLTTTTTKTGKINGLGRQKMLMWLSLERRGKFQTGSSHVLLIRFAEGLDPRCS
jgi:hypothetical protein